MRTKNCLPRFRYALSFSALLMVLPAVCLAQKPDSFQLSPPALQVTQLIDVEPQLGPQPPCGEEPIPPYPGLDDSAIVKSWSKSDFGRDWRPPACTGWAVVGFTTLVTTVARFRYTSEAGVLLRHIGAMIIFDMKSCDYCLSSIAAGQRWVREKIYDPRSNSQDPAYHYFHAEPSNGQEESCWEKHQIEQEIARIAVTTTKWTTVAVQVAPVETLE